LLAHDRFDMRDAAPRRLRRKTAGPSTRRWMSRRRRSRRREGWRAGPEQDRQPSGCGGRHSLTRSRKLSQLILQRFPAWHLRRYNGWAAVRPSSAIGVSGSSLTFRWGSRCSKDEHLLQAQHAWRMLSSTAWTLNPILSQLRQKKRGSGIGNSIVSQIS
jgi:hypothetical protein